MYVVCECVARVSYSTRVVDCGPFRCIITYDTLMNASQKWLACDNLKSDITIIGNYCVRGIRVIWQLCQA